jgi:putative solute:sodium symporter small subunit
VGCGIPKTRTGKTRGMNVSWYAFMAYFFAGAFLVNGIPHFIHGISGKKFRTPFSRPMTTGESSPVLNVIWGVVNFLIGYALVYGVGQFELGFNLGAFMLILGAIIMAVVLALILTRMQEH